MLIETIDLPELIAIGIMVEAQWEDLPRAVPAAWEQLFAAETGATSFLEVSVGREAGVYRELVATSRPKRPKSLLEWSATPFRLADICASSMMVRSKPSLINTRCFTHTPPRMALMQRTSSSTSATAPGFRLAGTSCMSRSLRNSPGWLNFQPKRQTEPRRVCRRL